MFPKERNECGPSCLEQSWISYQSSQINETWLLRAMKKIKQAKVIESDRVVVTILDTGDQKGVSKEVAFK